MCGIAGRMNFDHQQPVDRALIYEMTAAIAHRGPDGDGQYVWGQVGLGHRRLSIIDPNGGAQPLSNEDESVWITFNGEIYNYQGLRRDLLRRGHVLRSDSDTEVIVHLWEEHGPRCVEHLQGMFAFAIWDARQRSLFLARDRVGIKPLYYCVTETALIFGSEIKAMLIDPAVVRTLDPRAIDIFLTYLYVPGARTMFQHVRKLEPGHWLLAVNGRVTTNRYWQLTYEERGDFESIDEAAEALDSLLAHTVKAHMISDVPIGFLASGGVDSTALLSYAVDEASQPVQTFTVGFSGNDVVDERPYARMASRQFGTRHHETTISAQDFGDWLPRYVWHMEEPVCEPPAIALYYVARMAREHVRVLLSGEGGDEAFAGYPEYRHYVAFERWKPAGRRLRRLAGMTLALAGLADRTRRLQKYAAFADSDVDDYYLSRTASPASHFNAYKYDLYTTDFAAALDGFTPNSITRELFKSVAGLHLLNRLLYVDTSTWLPDDLLLKADKMTMATSVELRVPFLDHEVLEFAARLPTSYKVKGGQGKHVLRHTFRDRLPAAILDRKKAGFPVPYARWLSTDLREMVLDTVLSQAALSRGYFRRDAVESLVHGGTQTAAETFALLVLELWHRQFADTVPPLRDTPAYPEATVTTTTWPA